MTDQNRRILLQIDKILDNDGDDLRDIVDVSEKCYGFSINCGMPELIFIVGSLILSLDEYVSEHSTEVFIEMLNKYLDFARRDNKKYEPE